MTLRMCMAKRISGLFYGIVSMRKLIRKAALFITALVFAIETTASAQLLFVTNNGAIMITGYAGGNVVNIPAMTNGLPVTVVSNYAFWFGGGISSISIPGSVTNVGQNAFGECTGATNITMGDGVVELGQSAFYHCVSVRQMGIPNSVVSIGDFCFRRCSSLTNLNLGSGVRRIGAYAFADSGLASMAIPASVTNIGAYAFFEALNLKAITVDPLNLVYSSQNDVLFEAGGTILLRYPLGKAGSYTFPAGVISIADSAFAGCAGINNVTLNAGLTTIGNSAFARSGVANVTIPPSVTSIGVDAFFQCYGLTSMTIPDAVTNIGNQAFILCFNLENVSLGTNVTTIGQSAFGSCGLTNVTLPNSLTTIGPSAFQACKLRDILIPASVTNIGLRAFNVTTITNISVDPLNPTYSSVDGVLFSKDQSALVQYPLGRSVSYFIPSGTSKILDYAFIGCVGLTNVTIPASVTNIGSIAFNGCTKLATIYFQGNAPSLGAFALPSTNGTIYYRPGTVNWTSPFGGRPAVLWNPSINSATASFAMQSNHFGFDIVGSTNIPLAIQACTNLTSPTWTTVKVCTLTNGSIRFSDSVSTNSFQQFYRIQPP